MSSALVLALAASSCVKAQWQRQIVLQPLPTDALRDLVPGESDLEHCLGILGAPNFVWERSGDAIAIAYGAYRHQGWQLGASVNVARGVNASFDYGELEALSRGYVLLFDQRWKLESVSEGLLRDLSTEFDRTPPQSVE
ncbi:MAG: hypothetical protein FJ298_09490 [Planctomycetes bacterium]|nr:hypothetical protein [Planctomycetota bacterium]